MIQYSDEWWAARVGKVTASRVIDILPSRKTGRYNASRKNYMAEKAIESLTGKVEESFTSAAMQWGTDTEPLARAAYEAETGNMVKEVGFIDHLTIKNFGASPDGEIDITLNLEIKCPNSATHFDLILGGKVKFDYIVQMNSQMMCTGATRTHFVSYDPRVPDNLSFMLFAFTYDNDLCKEIEKEVNKFNAELDEMLKKLRSK